MAGKLYTPARPPELRSLLIRVGVICVLLVTVTLVLYAEGRSGGLKDESHHGAAPGFWDCVYFTMVTVTTVGYGDIVPVELRPRLVDAFLLTPVRFIVIFIFFGTAYQLTIKRFREDYRMNRAVSKLEGHSIVCGYGATGRAAVRELLLQGTPPDQVVVLETSDQALSDATDVGVVAVLGDAARESVLKSVAIERAAHVLVCVDRDDTAVLITLTAHDLNPEARVIAMCREAENVRLLERSGAHTIISPASAGGNLMAAATRRAHLVETMQDILSVGGNLHLDERKVRPDEVGKRPSELAGVAVLRVYRGASYFDVAEPPILKSGDTMVYVSASSART